MQGYCIIVDCFRLYRLNEQTDNMLAVTVMYSVKYSVSMKHEVTAEQKVKLRRSYCDISQECSHIIY